jgi:hypothetical protein
MRAVVLVIMLVNSIAWPAQLIAIVLLQRRATPPWQIGLAVPGFALGGLAGAGWWPPCTAGCDPGSC